MSRLEDALRWLIPLLEAHGNRYHITGGFAAHLYGARRPVNDIDIDLPREVLDRLAPAVGEHLVFGPGRYQDSTWDLYLMTLEYRGQEIDLTAVEGGRIANKRTGEWDELVMNLDEVELLTYAGMQLRVQNRRDLIAYKGKIAYDEEKHLEDIAAIEREGPCQPFTC
jgi:hypothetical protein